MEFILQLRFVQPLQTLLVFPLEFVQLGHELELDQVGLTSLLVESTSFLDFLGKGDFLLDYPLLVDALLAGVDGHRVLGLALAEVDVELDLPVLGDPEVISGLPHFVEKVGGGLEEPEVTVVLHLVLVDAALEDEVGILNMLQGDEEEQLLVLVEGELQVDVEVAFLEMVVDGEVLFVRFGKHRG